MNNHKNHVEAYWTKIIQIIQSYISRLPEDINKENFFKQYRNLLRISLTQPGCPITLRDIETIIDQLLKKYEDKDTIPKRLLYENIEKDIQSRVLY